MARTSRPKSRFLLRGTRGHIWFKRICARSYHTLGSPDMPVPTRKKAICPWRSGACFRSHSGRQITTQTLMTTGPVDRDWGGAGYGDSSYRGLCRGPVQILRRKVVWPGDCSWPRGKPLHPQPYFILRRHTDQCEKFRVFVHCCPALSHRGLTLTRYRSDVGNTLINA